MMQTYSPWRTIFPVALGTCLSLLGDASIYAVLPIYTAEAGITLGSVGIMLSANRFIRVLLNGPIGIISDRLPRRILFLPALFLGAFSTALYALAEGFWVLLIGRLLWGLSWIGIWVAGNAIVFDMSNDTDRGRWVGLYQTAFLLGLSLGAIIGGVLTDWLGYHRAMAVEAAISFIGAVVALVLLVETKPHSNLTTERSPSEPSLSDDSQSLEEQLSQPAPQPPVTAFWTKLSAAVGLYGVNRLIWAGCVIATLGLFLVEQVGETVTLYGNTIGVATMTGILSGVSSMVGMVATPIIGNISDKAMSRTRSRWQVAAGGLLLGVIGLVILSSGYAWAIVLGILLGAIASGSNQGISTTIVGDISQTQQRGRNLGILFTVGDLTSAVGPVLTYALIPLLGLGNLYLISAGFFALMLFLSIQFYLTK
ncbi:MAG: MFS transporter [Chloroflexota bacterium]